MARNQQKLNHYFWSFFGFCPFYDQIKHKKVSKSSNAEKNGLGEYQTINSRHFLLSCNPFWQSSDFLVTIGPSRSVCSGSEKQRRPAKGSGNRKPTLLNFITKRKGILRDPHRIKFVEKSLINIWWIRLSSYFQSLCWSSLPYAARAEVPKRFADQNTWKADRLFRLLKLEG